MSRLSFSRKSRATQTALRAVFGRAGTGSLTAFIPGVFDTKPATVRTLDVLATAPRRAGQAGP